MAFGFPEWPIRGSSLSADITSGWGQLCHISIISAVWLNIPARMPQGPLVILVC
jgi:hypothetical protein